MDGMGDSQSMGGTGLPLERRPPFEMAEKPEDMGEYRSAEVDVSTSGGLGEQIARLGVSKASLLDYLEGAPVLVDSGPSMVDEITGEGGAFEDDVLWDGRWSWRAALPYYVRRHDARIPDELAEWIVARTAGRRTTSSVGGDARADLIVVAALQNLISNLVRSWWPGYHARPFDSRAFVS